MQQHLTTRIPGYYSKKGKPDNEWLSSSDKAGSGGHRPRGVRFYLIAAISIVALVALCDLWPSDRPRVSAPRQIVADSQLACIKLLEYESQLSRLANNEERFDLSVFTGMVTEIRKLAGPDMTTTTKELYEAVQGEDRAIYIEKLDLVYKNCEALGY